MATGNSEMPQAFSFFGKAKQIAEEEKSNTTPALVFADEKHSGWDLSQSDQTAGMEFALCSYNADNGEATPLHPFVRCREYFGDIVYAHHHNKPNFSQYGFRAYEVEHDHASDFYLALKFRTVTARKTWSSIYFRSVLRWTLQGNKYLVKVVNEKDNYLLLHCNKFYMQSPVAMSWLTFLLRIGWYWHPDMWLSHSSKATIALSSFMLVLSTINGNDGEICRTLLSKYTGGDIVADIFKLSSMFTMEGIPDDLNTLTAHCELGIASTMAYITGGERRSSLEDFDKKIIAQYNSIVKGN